MGFNFNAEWVKYVVLALTAPFWWPFFKALYEEFNMALEEEGGLFGQPPTGEQLARIRLKRANVVEAMVSLPLEGAQAPEGARSGNRRPAAAQATPAASRPAPGSSGTNRRGFGPRSRPRTTGYRN